MSRTRLVTTALPSPQYNHLTYEHPAITCILVKDLPLEKQFDVALSLSRSQ